MEKKNRPCGGGFDISNDIGNCPAIITKRTPKAQEAFIYISATGEYGSTENDILKHCRLSSGRNYYSKLERTLNITFERISDPNPDGIGSHYRYRIRNQTDALKIINHINYRAWHGNYKGLSQEQINSILSLYPTE
ncbi:hypothetical protein ABN363_03680 [Providencia rettgeri]|uniref:Uncharacterized protein n=1 Tax=Providencia rettgeri TaxID=587 RepID=A0AAE2ZFI8_PRORE|nr:MULTISPECIES: hypothetical protein [Providencia]MBN6362585.1 hypothetical protein [Providencia huaxiensis]MBW3117126.1 hypothetical protein [Providencia rettgeri]MCD2527995.1 hypothetical protein [Providencia huaxiensis]MDL9986233.1 hypothetical protein [Providencia rettgeri]NHN52521.1 hypothetical protein [Providencia rettgeri]